MTAVLPHKSDGSYTFASQPRALQHRKKYRDIVPANKNENVARFGNIMYDRRVVRGNTWANTASGKTTSAAGSAVDPIAQAAQSKERRRRQLAQRHASKLDESRLRTPEPVAGRLHTDVQTELYLEELSERIEEADVECQTDAFLDRAPSPLFVAAKTGSDVATQIEEGDLFDFDMEVQPIVEVLVGKTVEQSLLEVMEEEELADLRTRQREFMELRNADLVEEQRLEEQNRRRNEEKERRLRQQRDVVALEGETKRKLAAQAFANGYLKDLVPTVFGNLKDNGYFYDPVEKEIQQRFLPWLMHNVAESVDRRNVSRNVLDCVIREVLAKQEHLYGRVLAERRHSTGGVLAEEEHHNGGVLAEEEHHNGGVLAEEEHHNGGVLAEEEHHNGGVLAEEEHHTEVANSENGEIVRDSLEAAEMDDDIADLDTSSRPGTLEEVSR